MASSTYFANEPGYWPYHPSLTDPVVSSGDSQFSGTDFQFHPQGSYPKSSESSQSSSLLETLLRHGKDALADSYVAPSYGKAVTSSAMTSQTPPYTPPTNDRTSPMNGPGVLLGDASSTIQDRFRQSQDVALGYSQNYQTFSQAQAPNEITPTSPTQFDNVQQQSAYSNNAYANNNNVGKSSPTENSEYGEEQTQRQVDYPWMKSGYANGSFSV